MSGSYPVTSQGPDTHVVSAAVVGGQLVFPDSGNPGMVKPTTGQADGTTCLGMAMNDAVPAGSGSNLAFGTAPPTASVAYGPATVLLTAGAGSNLTYGQLVCAGPAGTVIAGTTPTLGQFVGRCVEPAGIAVGSIGRVRLFG
jgi:hypothetical protein